MTKQSEHRKDVENVEAWAEILKEVLYCVPIELRAQMLALATKNEEAEREVGIRLIPFPELGVDNRRPGHRHWHAIMRLKSLVVQVFVRSIANKHSRKDATQILFAPHPYGSGSGLLRDYLHD
jgi:hypothetical protein